LRGLVSGVRPAVHTNARRCRSNAGELVF
jgi:hypothetical protein